MVTPASSAAARSRCCKTASASRELRLGVDAAHVVLPGFDRDRLQAHIAGDGNRIGEIVFAFGVAIADARRAMSSARCRRQAPSGRHCRARSCVPPRVASRSSRMATNSPPLRQQPAVAGRIRGREAEHRDGRAFAPARRAACSASRRRTSGVSANITRISSAPRSIAACARQHRMRGAEPLALLENLRVRRQRARLVARPRRDRARPPARCREQPASCAAASTCASSGAPADLVQHLRPRRAHARALAGREHDRKACALRHWSFTQAVALQP